MSVLATEIALSDPFLDLCDLRHRVGRILTDHQVDPAPVSATNKLAAEALETAVTASWDYGSMKKPTEVPR